jgi:endogenous inhibitor of DNA gyrase (YacG/DUF329 family)
MIKVTCPICGQAVQGASTAEWPEFPFCGIRCRTIDLGRWLGGAYVIRPETDLKEPAQPTDEDRIP